MKQEIISYLSTEKDDLCKLNKFIYDNPENSYNEFKACEYISKFLKERAFKITEKFLGLDTSFYASKGNGHPKICLLCDYDAIKNEGHLTGHNLLTTMSIAAAIGLGKIIDKIGGTIVVIGCPGEYVGGTKGTMVRQGVFDDMNAVLLAHPDIVTCESGSSSAVIPLNIKFLGNSGLSFLNTENYNSLDAILLTFNILNSLQKGFPRDVSIDSILSKGGYSPSLIPIESEAKFYIRAKDMDVALLIEKKIRETVFYVSKLIGIQNSISLYEPPSEELITNRVLNRLFSHNLKEVGVIDICPPRDIKAGLSVGSVSHKVATIHPYISIVNDKSIKYGTKAFGEATLSQYALEMTEKTSLALAFTGLDLIQSETLLGEVTNEFFQMQKSLY